MDATFTPSEQRFRAECRAWLSDNVPARFPELESPDGFPVHRAWDRALFDAGWSVITWPRCYGGREASLIEWLIFEEEYHRAGGGLRPAHNGISLLAPALFEYGTDEQRESYLRPMASAEHVWCQGWSEPGSGSDLASLRSRAERDPAGGWRLTGHKTWSTRAAFSTHIFGLFRTGDQDGRHRCLTYFLVPLDTPGIEVRGFGRLGGEAGFADVFFDAAHVPDSAVLGPLDGGWRVAMSTTSNERGLTLRSPGWFLAAAERLAALWRERADPSDDRLADRVARCWSRAQAYRWQTFAVAADMAKGIGIGDRSSMAKVFWSELLIEIHEVALELLGDDALSTTDPWVREYLTSLSGPIWGGTNEIQRNIVAERVLGLPRR